MPNSNEIELNVSGGGSGEIGLQLEGLPGGTIMMSGEQSGGGQDGPFVRKAEAWAVGTRNGVAIPVDENPNTPDSENNAKRYAELSQQYAGAGAGFVVNTGVIDHFPKVIQDSRIDASTVVENDYIFSDMDLGWVTTAGEIRLYGTLKTGETKPSVQLRLKKYPGLIADPYAMTLELVTSNSQNGNYLVARARNLLPGIQYNCLLFKLVDGGSDVQVYSIGAVTGLPTYNWWFQEVPRGLEDGEDYYVILRQSGSNTDLAGSDPVTFSGGENVPAPSLSTGLPGSNNNEEEPLVEEPEETEGV